MSPDVVISCSFAYLLVGVLGGFSQIESARPDWRVPIFWPIALVVFVARIAIGPMIPMRLRLWLERRKAYREARHEALLEQHAVLLEAARMQARADVEAMRPATEDEAQGRLSIVGRS